MKKLIFTLIALSVVSLLIVRFISKNSQEKIIFVASGPNYDDVEIGVYNASYNTVLPLHINAWADYWDLTSDCELLVTTKTYAPDDVKIHTYYKLVNPLNRDQISSTEFENVSFQPVISPNKKMVAMMTVEDNNYFITVVNIDDPRFEQKK